MIDTQWALGWAPGISQAMGLAAVALVGYLFGRRSSSPASPPDHLEEVERAATIARQLETIAESVRADLAFHRTQVDRFKKRLRAAANTPDHQGWELLRNEAELVLAPTLQLVSQLSSAYDKIRLQSQALANFTGGRSDPDTGLANGKALGEYLENVLATRGGQRATASVAVLSIEAPAPADPRSKDLAMRQAAELLRGQLRETDFAARYGADEFVVVMGGADLSGARVFGTRLRRSLADRLGLVASCGLAVSLPADTPKSLLARADSALYSARASAPGGQFTHTGASIRPDEAEAPAPGAPVRGTGAPAEGGPAAVAPLAAPSEGGVPGGLPCGPPIAAPGGTR